MHPSEQLVVQPPTWKEKRPVVYTGYDQLLMQERLRQRQSSLLQQIKEVQYYTKSPRSKGIAEELCSRCASPRAEYGKEILLAAVVE